MPKEENKKDKSFFQTKLFTVLVSVFATILVIGLVEWIIFIVIPSLDEGGIEEDLDTKTLVVSKLDFDSTGKSGWNITFVFNQDVVKDDEIGKDTDIKYFSFTPEIPEGGVFIWESTYRLTFKPNTALRPSTKYIADLNTSSFSFWKGDLTTKTKYEFHTQRFTITNVSGSTIKDLENKNVIQYKYNVFFNLPVLPEDIKNNTKILLDNKEITYKIEDVPKESKAVTTLSLFTEDIEKLDKIQYLNLVIKDDLKCLGCEIGLEKDFKDSTRIDRKEYLNIYDIAVFTRESDKQYIKLSLSHQVDADKIAPYISISPKLDFKLAGGNFYLEIDGDFEIDKIYEITLSKGYEAIYGATIKETITREILIDSLRSTVELEYPSMDFTAQGMYLPKEKAQKISVNTINVDKINVEVSRIFSNNIVYFLQQAGDYYYDNYYYSYNYNDYRIGKNIHSETIDVKDSSNMRIYTDIDLTNFISDKSKGIYRLNVRDYNDRWRYSSKWLVATDLGIVAKKSGKDLLVWVNSLKTLKAKPFVKVKLISFTNQVIAEGKTDRNGIFKFSNLSEVIKDYNPFVITAETDDDFSFLKLGYESRLSTVDFDVSGSYIPKGLESYLYMDRNIFRPGDKANLVAVVRSTQQTDVPQIPVKLKIRNPKNQISHELRGNLDEANTVEFNFDIPSYSLTGYYTAELLIADDEVIGTYNFQVEDFMPNTIKVEINMDKESYEPGDDIAATVNGMSLYGPPAANKKVTGKITLNSMYFSPAGYKSYTFGDSTRKSFSSYTDNLGEYKLDEEGNYTYKYSLNENLAPPSIIKGTFSASVFDTGGRAVSSAKTVYIYPYDYYIGVKRSGSYYVQTDMPVPFNYVVLDKDGNEKEIEELYVTVEKAYWVNILKKGSDGKLRYVSERRQDIVEEKTLKGSDLEKPYTYVPVDSGSYTIILTIPNSNTSTSIGFYAYGWGGDSFSLAEPNKLLLELDKDVYNVGDIANIIVKSPFAGKLLLTVERDRVLFNHIVDLDKNTANIKLKIAEEYGPNAYISGVIIRSIDHAEPFTPVRAFGVVALKIDDSNTKLDLEIKAPEKMEPNKPISIELSVNAGNINSTRVTIAAVDEGILQLTNYKNPNPHSFFYRKRALEINTFDIYNFILPDEEKVKLLYSNPGDENGTLFDKESTEVKYLQKSSTKRVKPISLWSGVVKIDENNKAVVTMDVPEFNGTLRIMAVAIDGESYGATSTKTIVRAPIVLSPTFPRFLSIRDKYVFPVGVYNDTGKDADIKVTLKDNGFVELDEVTKKAYVREGKEEIIYFNVTSLDKIGDVYFTLTGEGNGKKVEKKIEMQQRSYQTPITEVKTGAIKSGESVTLEEASEGWIKDTCEYSLSVSSLPTIKFSNSLRYLLRYPYGCAEQTTSTIFPLLYFEELVKTSEPKLFEKNNASWYLERGIRKLEAMQLYNGSIAYWPNGTYTNEWSSIYAGHFLIEAKKAGYQVSDRVIKKLITWLKTVVNRAYTVQNSQYKYGYKYELQRKAYAHYVLALAGEPQLAGIFYMKNNLLGDLGTQAKYQLIGALALAGQFDLSRELIEENYKVEDEERETGGNFNSSVKTIAIMLNVLAEIDNTHPMIPGLMKDLESRAYFGRWYSTQENCYAMLAMGKLYKSRKNDNYKIKVVDSRMGQLGMYQSGEKPLRINLDGNNEISMSMEGTGEAYYTLTIFGVPEKEVEPYDKAIKIRREFLNANGDEVDLSDIRTGQLLVAKITISANKYMENVAILDFLPSGFEIENPRLATSEALSWAQSSYVADYMDMRDDRLLLFSNIGNYTRVFYYTVRAVTEGSFKVPAIMAEAMYNPDYSSLSSAGTLTINK